MISPALTQTRAIVAATCALSVSRKKAPETVENSDGSCCFPDYRTAGGPGFPRTTSISLADNFVQKQQKQQYTRNYRPAYRFAHLVNESKHSALRPGLYFFSICRQGAPALAYRAKQCRFPITGYYCGSVMRRLSRLAAALASARRFEEAVAVARSRPRALAATVKSGE